MTQLVACILKTMAHISRLAVAVGICAVSVPVFAAGTRAGDVIESHATADYTTSAATTTSINSNELRLVVDEILDVSLTSSDPGDVLAAPSATGVVLGFLLTNAGNGPEAFRLTVDANAGGDDFNPDATSIYIDDNGNGVYDAGVDILYDASSPPQLEPDETVKIFVLGNMPSTVSDGQRSQVGLNATAVSGNGAAGTVITGAGEGGSNAVVGANGAQDQAIGFYAIAHATITLNKSATVLDPFGGTTRIPGAIITYSLVAEVAGSGSLIDVVISDPIPTGTQYVPNSIIVDNVPLSDSTTDADGASFDGSKIAVRLGDVAAGTRSVITFQVEIEGRRI